MLLTVDLFLLKTVFRVSEAPRGWITPTLAWPLNWTEIQVGLEFRTYFGWEEIGNFYFEQINVYHLLENIKFSAPLSPSDLFRL